MAPGGDFRSHRYPAGVPRVASSVIPASMRTRCTSLFFGSTRCTSLFFGSTRCTSVFSTPHDVLHCFLLHTMYFTVFCSTRCTSVIWRTLASAAGDVQGPDPRRHATSSREPAECRTATAAGAVQLARRAVKSIQLVTSTVGTQIVCVAAPPHANRSSRAHRRQRDELPLPQRGMDGDKHRRRAER